MFDTLPTRPEDFLHWRWEQFQPFYADLEARELTADNVIDWLTDWARLGQRVREIYSRLSVATTLDTTDEEAEKRLIEYIGGTVEPARAADQKLKEKLLASGIEPPNYKIQMRAIRNEAEIFRSENLPLFTEEDKLRTEYDKIIGAQTVEWDGEERTIAQIKPLQQDPDRSVRERAWRLTLQRQLADRGALNDLWGRFLKLRQQIASNADMPDYRAYIWRAYGRFDYTPEDCLQFHRAIEETVVPAAERIYERRRMLLGLDTLRPWDLEVDPHNRPPLKPFTDAKVLDETAARIFRSVDPALGEYYTVMQKENLLDLPNRKGKAPGGYCTYFPVVKRPFIFMNAVGLHDDVQTLLHEGGHAFHAFETSKLPDYMGDEVPIEFCEVASMSMELLAAPYLSKEHGGFYDPADATRARVEHLERNILFWPYMAVVDAFQHWVYTHVDDAMNPDNCDEAWARQWDRFMRGIDYSGLKEEKETGWHRKLHIFQIPFYYVEYGLAQLGAMQVWANALNDQAGAVANYLAALALGGTVGLPDLFKRAGVRFAMDSATLGSAVAMAERVIHELEAV